MAYKPTGSSGHINSEVLLARQAETYEAKLQALGELLESEKRLALENQAARYQRKLAELEDIVNDTSTRHAELAAEKERLEQALPSSELLSGDLRSKPVTERANELADDIDRCTDLSFIRLMRSIDGQIFSGYRQYQSLTDVDIQEMIETLAALCSEYMSTPHESVIVLGGAGTSGRVAFSLCRAFNSLLEKHGKTPCFRFCIAGGDPALFRSVEGAEDDPANAVADLQRAETSPSGSTYHRVLYIGISCGLSATYVGAQLEYAMNAPSYATVCVGFNPIQLARQTVVSGWGKSFSEIVQKLEQKSKVPAHLRQHFLLTPVVGPEAIQGSSRLKGGSATKIMLECVFALAASQTLKLPLLGGPPVPKKAAATAAVPQTGDSQGLLGGIFTGSLFGLGSSAKTNAGGIAPVSVGPFKGLGREIFLAYEATLRAVYTAPVHELMVLAAETLRAGRSVWYVGTGGTAVAGMIDASEQVPTFGAKEKDVRAFICGGWEALGLYQALGVLTAGTSLPAVSTEHFLERVLPQASTSDLVILLHSHESGLPLTNEEMPKEIGRLKGQLKFQLAVLEVTPAPLPGGAWDQKENMAVNKPNLGQSIDRLLANADCKITITLPDQASQVVLPGVDAFGDFAMKLALNLITTGAYVRLGKVYRSRMIDVRVTNLKLYRRACTIVAEISGVKFDQATECIIRAIHDVDVPKPLPKTLLELPIEEHLVRARQVPRLVPTAILVATGKHTLATARRDLREGIPIRDLVVSATSSK